MHSFDKDSLAGLAPPTSSASVFKDDCMFSFDTALDGEGLDICMHCFQAFSRGEFDYTKKHSTLFDHSLFLTLKKQRKPKPHKLAKVLKLEVKEQAEDELYETYTSIYCAEDDTTVSYPTSSLPEAISRTAEGILKATSIDKKQEVKSWQQDIRVCPHATDIVQMASTASLHQCSQCGLDTNLWLCLTCGNVGCGRAQFGGVPGNSHAVSHNSEHHDHHVAVKLGSLSSDSADCYCYTCDDDVKVPELTKYLSFYGIDIAQHEKTEKNLTELQIEQNIQWDFKMDSNGESLEPVFGKGLTGFKNLGNSCYMASVLQALFAVKPFQDAYFSEEGVPLEKIVGNTDPANDLETQLYKIGDGLLSGRYSVPDESTTETIKYQRGIKPSGFKALIGKGHPEFSTMQQQDAFEFWTHLMEKIDEAKAVGSISTAPTEVFHYVSEDKLRCTTCGGVRLTPEVEEHLCVPVEAKLVSTEPKQYAPVTMEDCVAKWHSPEIIEYECPVCKKKTPATKEQGFMYFSKYLVISPQRISLENWVPVKLGVPIKFSEKLELRKFKSTGKLPGESELPVDEEPAFEFNPELISALESMGFSENRCKKALYATGNSDAEAAANWLFEHMDDPDIDTQFAVPSDDHPKVSEADIEQLVNMGFVYKLANKALILNGGNIEQSVDWLFNHPDDNGELPTETPEETPQTKLERLKQITATGTYDLLAVVCHKGNSIHSGHYVAFIKKQLGVETKWVLFNDEKVVLAGQESLKEVETSGYLYIYRSI